MRVLVRFSFSSWRLDGVGFMGCVWAFSFYVRADISLGGMFIAG